MSRIWNRRNPLLGLERYTMDGDINIDVTTGGDDDAIQNMDNDLDISATNDEVAQGSAEVTAADQANETVDMLLTRARMCRNYIRHYGVTEELFMLQDYDGFLTAHIGRRPAMESFGDPYNSVAYAAMEGLGDAAKSVWEWIKKMCRKFLDWLQELWAKIMRIFEDQKSQISRLEQLRNKRKDRDFENSSVPSIKVLSFTALERLKDTIESASEKNKSDVEDIDKQVAAEKGLSDDELETAKNEIDAFSDKLDEVIEWDTEEANNAKENAKKYLDFGKNRIEVGKSFDKHVKTLKEVVKKLEKRADELEKKANDASKYEDIKGERARYLGKNGAVLPAHNWSEEKRQEWQTTHADDGRYKPEVKGQTVAEQQSGDKDLAKGLKNTVNFTNKVISFTTKCSNTNKKVISACITSASRYIAKGTVTQ